MGYSHYWYRPVELDRDKFKAAAADCRQLARNLGTPITGPLEEGDAVFSDDQVAFNGQPPYEPFKISRIYDGRRLHPENPMKFDFCKTNHRPYDVLVMGCLILFKHHFGADFRVYSDGRIQEWQAGVDLVRKLIYIHVYQFLEDGLEVS